MDNDEGAALATALPLERRLTVAIDGDADLIAANLDPRPFGIDFDLVERGEPPISVSLQVPGCHNVSHALAATGAARAAGVPLAHDGAALDGFTATRRRNGDNTN